VAKRVAAIVVSAALGLGTAALVACGEDRSGSVKFEGDTGTATETTPTATTSP